MKNTDTEILNQVMSRWAANFRASQATQGALNETAIKTLGIFNLLSEERLLLTRLNQSFQKKADLEIFV